MNLKLESLKYKEATLLAIIKVFEGTVRSTFDKDYFEGIRSNRTRLTLEEVKSKI